MKTNLFLLFALALVLGGPSALASLPLDDPQDPSETPPPVDRLPSIPPPALPSKVSPKIATSDLPAADASSAPAQPEEFDALDKTGISPPALDSARRSRAHECPKDFSSFWKFDEADDQADLDYRIFRYSQQAANDDPLAEKVVNAYLLYRKSRGEVPYQYLQVAQRRIEKERVQRMRAFITSLFMGEKGFLEAFDESERPEISKRLAESSDPLGEVQAESVEIFITTMMDKPLWSPHMNLKTLQTRYAIEVFDWHGKGPIPDADFYNLAGAVLASIGSDSEFLGLHRPLRLDLSNTGPKDDGDLAKKQEQFRALLRALRKRDEEMEALKNKPLMEAME